MEFTQSGFVPILVREGKKRKKWTEMSVKGEKNTDCAQKQLNYIRWTAQVHSHTRTVTLSKECKKKTESRERKLLW